MIRRYSVWSLLVLLAVGPSSGLIASPPTSITDQEVQLAIGRAVDYVWSQQGRDGRWVSPEFEKSFPHGLTALTVFTLRSAGASLSDRRLQRAIISLLDANELNTVYARALRLLMWCSLDPERFEREIAEDVHFLKLQQGQDGSWGYGTLSGIGTGEGRQDNSNSQLALLALGQAAVEGAEVNQLIWRRAEQSWLESQNQDGGWGYPVGRAAQRPTQSPASYGSMTAAGLASLYLIYDRLYLDAQLDFNGRFKARCGEDVETTRPLRSAMERGWSWWNKNFRADMIPQLTAVSQGEVQEAYLTYYLYAVDRVGMLSGRKRFGQSVWFGEVADQLVNTQQADGSWGSVHKTCFGILSLLKGRAPVLINKLGLGGRDEWGVDSRDAANLTRWFSRRFETPLAWQMVDLEADDSDLYDAPILLITGHDAPKLSDSQRASLRDYVLAGGTILAVACCSRPEFVEGCREMFSNMFPLLTFGTLAQDHPVWSIHDPLTPGEDCLGYWDGCRTSVFLLPNAACCAWHQNLIDSEGRRFALAGNILRYATFGRSLAGRLTPFVESRSMMPLATVKVARLRHDGDWWADPDGLIHQSKAMARRLGLGIDRQEAVSADRVRDSAASALWLTGHDYHPPDSNGRVELKSWLASGGTLVASACCGRKKFDEGFRDLAADLFGSGALKPIAPDDPLMTGSFAPGLASPLNGLSYRRRHRGTPPARIDWPILYGVRHRDRWVVVYSPYDLNCAIAGHSCLDCVGYVTADANAIVGNILLSVAQQQSDAD